MDKMNWYALRAKSRKESVLYQQLLSKKIECFFPRVIVNPVNSRASKTRPYFPGYMFVRANLIKNGNSVFQWMPHSLGLVGCGNDPGMIPVNIIVALKKRIAQIRNNGGLIYDQLHSGSLIKIIDGPFKGYDALFDTRLDGLERVRVLLHIINSRQMPVEMQVGQIALKT